MSAGLLPPHETELLRQALGEYTVDAVNDVFGLVGQAALARNDVAGAARAIRDAPDRVAMLARMFVLGSEITARDAAQALHPLPIEAACAAGILELTADSARALLDIRPHAEHIPDLPGSGTRGPHWWVVSDFGADVRPGPLAPDHVLGIGTASLTLAQATPRRPVETALDIGTGSGVQALHLSRHSSRVVATDVSERALRMAATTAALSGQDWGLRAGSLVEPVADERFDLVVANPPFVISPGSADVSGWEYRDGGGAGDHISERLTRSLPRVLAAGGSAHLLANWLIPRDGSWQERVGSWLVGSGCDAWVWQREVAEPGEYIALWLRDAGLTPGSRDWARRYDNWADWFAGVDAVAVGMGMISLWRNDATEPTMVLEDVPQALEQPIGAHLPGWVERARWLAATDDDRLLRAALSAADGIVLERSEMVGDSGWVGAAAALRQLRGMRWRIDIDDAVAGLVAACDGSRPLAMPIDVLAAMVDRAPQEVATAVLPVVRDLVQRGFLQPPEADH